MRIVHVDPYFYPFYGGIEHRIHNICSELGKDNEVTIVTSQLQGTEVEERGEGYDILRLKSRYFGNYNPPYVTSKGLKETLKALDPDVVEFHYRWAPSYTKDMAAHEGNKVFCWHNSFGEGEGFLQRAGSLANDRLFLPKLKKYDIITCISEHIRNQLIDKGVPPDKLEVIKNGVHMPSHVSGEEDGYILFVGRLVATKGLKYLIEAMKDIEMPLKICGKGPELEKLASLAKNLGVDDRVELLGYVSEEERDRLLDRCSVYVMPSIFEAYGIAAAEAMSHGKPLVATKTGGLPEVVQDAGVLVPPRDPAALAEGINSLISDDATRKEMGRRALELAEGYSWESVAQQTLDQYRRLV